MKGTVLARVDNLGAAVSLGCAVHCLLVPFIMILMPFSGLALFMHGTVERLFLLASFGLALASLCWGIKRHGHKSLALGFVGAFLLILTGKIWLDEPYDLFLVIPGALMLIGSHFLNRYFCKQCLHCTELEIKNKHEF